MNFGERVAKWCADRNLIEGSTPQNQMVKLLEEYGELLAALIKDDRAETVDAIGDCCVVLAAICAQLGLDFEACQESAWNEIKGRGGRMIEGVFVKEADLTHG